MKAPNDFIYECDLTSAKWKFFVDTYNPVSESVQYCAWRSSDNDWSTLTYNVRLDKIANYSDVFKPALNAFFDWINDPWAERSLIDDCLDNPTEPEVKRGWEPDVAKPNVMDITKGMFK